MRRKRVLPNSRRASYTTALRAPARKVHAHMLVAVRIATAFTHRLPTVQELQDRFGMSRATAYRWVSALKQAKGETHAG
jgi:predicted DNA-binding transcriptional regulator YafY